LESLRIVAFLLAGFLVLIAITGTLALVSNPKPVAIDDPPAERESILQTGIYFESPPGTACRHIYGGEVSVIDESGNPISNARVDLILSRESEQHEPRILVLDRKTSRLGHSYVQECLWDAIAWETTILHVAKDGYRPFTRQVTPRWEGEKTVILERTAYNKSLNSDAGKAGAG